MVNTPVLVVGAAAGVTLLLWAIGYVFDRADKRRDSVRGDNQSKSRR